MRLFEDDLALAARGRRRRQLRRRVVPRVDVGGRLEVNVFRLEILVVAGAIARLEDRRGLVVGQHQAALLVETSRVASHAR